MRWRPLPLSLAAALAALPAVAAAQGWSGDHGIRVTVADDAGQPVPEVRVIVRLAEADRSGGPPPMLTNDQGVVEVTGLSAGEWEIELMRQGFMIVNSYLRLQDGKRPQVGFTSSQRTGPFWAPMHVSYSSVGAASATARAGSARAMNRAQRRAERRAEQRERRLRRDDVARVVEPPSAPETPQPESTDVVEQPAPAPEPIVVAEQPVPEPESVAVAEQPAPAPEPVAVAEQPAPEPESVAAVEPPAAEPEPVVVAERPATEPEPEDVAEQPAPAPEPDPEPEPVVVRLLANPSLLPAGACPECAPGEWSVASHWPAEPRTAETTACAGDLAGRLERVAGIVEQSLPEEFIAYTGALASPEGNDVLRLLPPNSRAEVQELLIPVLDPERSCQVIGVLLPSDVRFVGFQYEAADLSARGGCLPEQPCDIGDAGWRGNPVIHRHDHGTFVYGVFENLSPDTRREANLKVYFRPPRGWLPPR